MLQLLLLPRLAPHPRQYIPQLVLVGLDPALELWDIIPRIAISSVKDISHADEGISLLLEILQDALIPRSRFIFQQILTYVQVPRGGADTFVQQGHVIRICCICVFGSLDQVC